MWKSYIKQIIHFTDPFSKSIGFLFLCILNSRITEKLVHPRNVVGFLYFQVTRQLYEPLVMQLIHWFTNNKKFESQDTVTFLEAILVGHQSSYFFSPVPRGLFLARIVVLLKEAGAHTLI